MREKNLLLYYLYMFAFELLLYDLRYHRRAIFTFYIKKIHNRNIVKRNDYSLWLSQ